MANKLYEETSVQAIADAIREKNGTTATYKVSEMGDAIRAIVGGNGNIPDYHYIEAFRVAQKIDRFKVDNNANYFILGAITDNHVFNGDTTYEELSKASVLHGAFALETVGTMTECDCVLNLGDNCWENGSHTDNAYQGSLYTTNVTKLFHERLTSFSLVGNHDKNDSTQTIYDLIGQYNDFDVWANTRIRSFGYKDFTDKKVRVIVLNTCDYLNASGGCGMSYEQKDFLMRALDLSVKSNASEWQILLLSHIPLDWNGGDYNFYTDLQAILIAYENGTTATITVNSSYALNETPSEYATYSSGKLAYNYSGKNVAKIIANIHGHVHTDACGKLANTNIVRMATPNTCFYLGKTESYPDYGDYSIDTPISRTANTATDTSATFYCIDLDDQFIYSYAFGAGNDRIVAYKDAEIYIVTYNLTEVFSSNNAINAVEGESYTTTLTVDTDYELNSVSVTMGGVDITSSVHSNGVITIPEVTGNIVITATAQDNYVPVWDIGNRTAVTDMYHGANDPRVLSRKHYYWGVSGSGAIYYDRISSCSVNSNDVTYTSNEKNVGIGIPYHLEAGTSYTFKTTASVKSRLRKIVYDASGVFVSGSEEYSGSGTDLTLTFTAPTDATQWVMLILDCYTANESVTHSNVTLTKN